MSISVSYQRFSSIVLPFCGDQLQLSQVCGRHHKAKRVLALKHMIVVHIKMSDRFQFFNFCFLYCCRIEVREYLLRSSTSISNAHRTKEGAKVCKLFVIVYGNLFYDNSKQMSFLKVFLSVCIPVYELV